MEVALQPMPDSDAHICAFQDDLTERGSHDRINRAKRRASKRATMLQEQLFVTNRRRSYLNRALALLLRRPRRLDCLTLKRKGSIQAQCSPLCLPFRILKYNAA